MTTHSYRRAAALAGIAGVIPLLAACGTAADATALDAATTPGAVATTTGPTTATPRAADRFGPDGYDGVELGTSAAQVRAAGSTVTDDGADAVCDGLRLRRDHLRAGEVSGFVSRRFGVALITAPNAAATTPEGIHDGSTRAEVRAAYPDAKRYPDFWSVAVPGRPGASYWWWYADGRLINLSLVLDVQDCAN